MPMPAVVKAHRSLNESSAHRPFDVGTPRMGHRISEIIVQTIELDAAERMENTDLAAYIERLPPPG